MPVPGPVGRPQPAEVHRYLARCVRAVHEGVDPARVELADDLLDREDRGRRARDVAHEGEPGPRCHGLQDCRDDLLVRLDLERQADDDHLGARGSRGLGQSVERGVVLVIDGQELVTGLEVQ